MRALTRDWALELLAAAAEALMPRLVFRPGNDSGQPGLALIPQRCPSKSGPAPVIGLPAEEWATV